MDIVLLLIFVIAGFGFSLTAQYLGAFGAGGKIVRFLCFCFFFAATGLAAGLSAIQVFAMLGGTGFMATIDNIRLHDEMVIAAGVIVFVQHTFARVIFYRRLVREQKTES